MAKRNRIYSLRKGSVQWNEEDRLSLCGMLIKAGYAARTGPSGGGSQEADENAADRGVGEVPVRRGLRPAATRSASRGAARGSHEFQSKRLLGQRERDALQHVIRRHGGRVVLGAVRQSRGDALQVPLLGSGGAVCDRVREGEVGALP